MCFLLLLLLLFRWLVLHEHFAIVVPDDYYYYYNILGKIPTIFIFICFHHLVYIMLVGFVGPKPFLSFIHFCFSFLFPSSVLFLIRQFFVVSRLLFFPSVFLYYVKSTEHRQPSTVIYKTI